ncbi:XdhC family protein [Leptolyngbya sp. NIES-2104]|uniref:XdhC family protein n=1 Tax=Leptolyngbya sp. NIES-2104 TaxID=1552121 RepID=UPI0006EC9C3A|nr:XdhC/CoxI family protein [Leptolyngbya sp. NIES-2104]GAP96865.1 xanthine and CO dehydrogenases maturation factor, XdhC/CoxF family [Leptolyngbya sp. NIES-2104]
MRELQAIVETYKQTTHSDQRAALATVVKVSGSTYRRPGAQMLITQDGHSVGTISGGCLEHDVMIRSQQVIATGNAAIVEYDSTSDDDIIWGLGLGCNGVVYILIECIELKHELNPLAFMDQCLHQQQVGVLATVFSVEEQATLLGNHLMLSPRRAVYSDIEDSNLRQAVLADAHFAYINQQPASKSYSVAGSVIEVFFNVIQPPVPLVIFGAGHDVSPVMQFAKALGWHVTVVDPRCSEASLTRFQTADCVLLVRLENVHEKVALSDQTIALVMTHNYLYDSKLLQLLLPSPVRYVGVLGPKHRTDRLLQESRAEGRIYGEVQLERLYSPVGIDIGAETSEEIALAIVSEIQAVLASRSSGFLRNRQAPIHDRVKPKPQSNVVQIDEMLMNV